MITVYYSWNGDFKNLPTQEAKFSNTHLNVYHFHSFGSLICTTLKAISFNKSTFCRVVFPQTSWHLLIFAATPLQAQPSVLTLISSYSEASSWNHEHSGFPQSLQAVVRFLIKRQAVSTAVTA
jgi:hypothetical protein